MLLFLICFFVTTGIGLGLIIGIPRKLTILFAFPFLVIVSFATALLYKLLLEDGALTPDEKTLVASASFAASFIIWFGLAWARREVQFAEMEKRLEEHGIQDEKKYEPSRHASPQPPIVLSGAAGMALEYRTELANELERVTSLGADWEERFLFEVNSNPKGDLQVFLRNIEKFLKETYPFGNHEVEALHQSLLPFGAEAMREFRRTLYALGEKVSPAEVSARIAEKFSQTGEPMSLPPGVYVAGNMRFRVRPDLVVTLLTGPSGEASRIAFDSFSMLRGAYPGVAELRAPQQVA